MRVTSSSRPAAAPLAGAVFLLAAIAAGCAGGRPAPAYRPVKREVTVTAIPLLTREMQRIYPFLARDFAPGGVLAGREVYAFEPQSITVVEGDTLALTLVNPEDDAHSFALPGLAVDMPGQSTVTATWVAAAAGLYAYRCVVPAHLPYMAGTVVVLPAATFPAR